MEITDQEFFKSVGRYPQQDDLDRANCPHAGKIDHLQCGWCEDHDKPRFICGCSHYPRPWGAISGHITILPGALPAEVTASYLERMPVIEMAQFVHRMGATFDGLTIRRKDVGDLTMSELAARGCETEKARKAFVESEGL